MNQSEFKCKNSPNIFCYLCGNFCVSSQRNAMTENTKTYYEMYFGRIMQNSEDFWVPKIMCRTSQVNLQLWWNGARSQMPFAVSTIWKKPRNHRTDCYFKRIMEDNRQRFRVEYLAQLPSQKGNTETR